MPKAVDLSEFQAEQRPHGPRCGVFRLQLEGEQRETFEAAMADESIGDRSISIVLRRWGYPLGDQVIRRHRRGLCACGK